MCRKADARSQIPRSLGQQIQAERPNEILTLDFFDVGVVAKDGEHYVLVLKDKFARFVDLIATEDKTAATAAKGIVGWISRFGTPKMI